MSKPAKPTTPTAPTDPEMSDVTIGFRLTKSGAARLESLLSAVPLLRDQRSAIYRALFDAGLDAAGSDPLAFVANARPR